MHVYVFLLPKLVFPSLHNFTFLLLRNYLISSYSNFSTATANTTITTCTTILFPPPPPPSPPQLYCFHYLLTLQQWNCGGGKGGEGGDKIVEEDALHR